MAVLALLVATVFTLAFPLPSNAGLRSGFVPRFPVSTFVPRAQFLSTTGGFVVVNSPLVSQFQPFRVPTETIVVRTIVVRRTPVLVTPLQPVILVTRPVFVTPVWRVIVPSRCFFDQFAVLRCFP
jgi:hypothetical protein